MDYPVAEIVPNTQPLRSACASLVTGRPVSASRDASARATRTPEVRELAALRCRERLRDLRLHRKRAPKR